MQAPINIWFNRTFATSYWLLHQLRANLDGVPIRLFATHVDSTSPVRSAADVFELEPRLAGEAYVQWALNFCERHDIRLLFVRGNQLLLTQAAQRFEALGVNLISPPATTVELLADKAATYELVGQLGFTLPPHRIVGNSQQLLQGSRELWDEVGDGSELIVKPTIGVGASGVRVLTQRPYVLNDLLAIHDPRVRVQDLARALDLAEDSGLEAPKLMLMAQLTKPEISVDALTSPDGELLVAIARIKESDRVTRLGVSEAALAQVKQLHAALPFAYLSNFQFMRWQNEDVLLEVNTRAAGGMYATQVSGVNLIWEATRLALGYGARTLRPKLGAAYAQIDRATPVKFEVLKIRLERACAGPRAPAARSPSRWAC